MYGSAVGMLPALRQIIKWCLNGFHHRTACQICRGGSQEIGQRGCYLGKGEVTHIANPRPGPVLGCIVRIALPLCSHCLTTRDYPRPGKEGHAGCQSC